MKLMTANQVVDFAKKYNIDLYLKDGKLQCNISSIGNATPAFKNLMRLHREVLRKHFGA